ncbi:MAG: diacylglycerol/polyprenol kinase family protein [Candidatus Neomarinimicrobiota bacterium]
MRQEIIRKSIHLSANSIIPLAYLFLNIPRIWVTILLGIVSVLFIMIDFGRTRYEWLSKIFGKLFNGMLRSHELEGKLTGASYVLIGSFLSVAIFPKEIAVLALLFTAVGDTAAALYGKKFGKLRLWNKTLEGSIAGLIACLIIILFFPQIPNIIKFSGAFAAMFIELLPIKIDDNLRIPLFSGFIMYILSNFII